MLYDCQHTVSIHQRACVCVKQKAALPNIAPQARGTACSFKRIIIPASVSWHTDVDSSPWVPLAPNQVLHPVDVVKTERDGGDEPFQGDLDGQPEVLFEQGAGEGSDSLRVLEVQPAVETRLR